MSTFRKTRRSMFSVATKGTQSKNTIVSNSAEVDLAAAVAAFAEAQGWTIHHEVVPPKFVGTGRPDLVGVSEEGDAVLVIETKPRLSLEGLAQTIRWRKTADHLYLACPLPRRKAQGRALGEQIAKANGFGILYVTSDEIQVQVGSNAPPPLEERRAALLAACTERTKGQVSGTNFGGYWTPFQTTLGNVEAALREAGEAGLTTRELVDKITHHYASDTSAMTSLPRWMQDGTLPNVERMETTPIRWRWRNGVE